MISVIALDSNEEGIAYMSAIQVSVDNARPQWLADAHWALDAAVAAAYGWDAGISEDEALKELLRLNSEKRT